MDLDKWIAGVDGLLSSKLWLNGCLMPSALGPLVTSHPKTMLDIELKAQDVSHVPEINP